MQRMEDFTTHMLLSAWVFDVFFYWLDETMRDMDDIHVIKRKRIRIHLEVYLQVNTYMITLGHIAHIQSFIKQ